MGPEVWLQALGAAAVALVTAFALSHRLRRGPALSQGDVFDLVVLFLTASTLLAVLLGDVRLWSGAVAIGTLFLLQQTLRWACARWPALGRILRGDPPPPEDREER